MKTKVSSIFNSSSITKSMNTACKWVGMLVIAFTIFSFRTDNLPPTFAKLLTQAKMNFTKMSGMTETPVIQNDVFNYDYAVKYSQNDFEVRYAVRPGKSSTMQADANFMKIVNSISEGKPFKSAHFDPTSVKNEFNANWGATSGMQLKKEFAQNYKYCLIVTIHKDNAGDAYVFFIGMDKDLVRKLAEPIFHALKFE